MAFSSHLAVASARKSFINPLFVRRLAAFTTPTTTATTSTKSSFSSLRSSRSSIRHFSRRSMSTTTTTSSSNDSPPMYWNRELCSKQQFDIHLPIVQPCKLISLADPNDPNNIPLHQGPLPDGVELLQIGTCLAEFDIEQLKQQQCNTIFVSHPKAKEPLAELIHALQPQWIHSRTAGIDFIFSPTLQNYQDKGLVTNAKGQFSSTLAEYTLLACGYFAKDFPKLMKQKQQANWNSYPILELRGATLGIVGFGDIGQAAARLAKAYGMKLKALTRTPKQSSAEFATVEMMDSTTNPKALNEIFATCDYVLVSTPLTPETHKMIGKEQFDQCKSTGTVLINVGRGPVIDEEALIDALQDDKCHLKGAALDVTTVEPLSKESLLWKLDNVLLSPHNMDMTETFMLESTEFFVQEQLPRFVRKLPLWNPVNVREGY